VDADGVAHLARAADPDRDQSYFLFATTREQLDFLRFPLGGMHKPAVRKAASALGLAVAAKPDSQDICFVPAGKYSDIVEKLRPGAVEAGDIVHMDGRIMGRHEGVIRYTIGQRRGLGVATIGESNWLGQGSLEEACAAGMPALARVRSTRAPVPGRMTVVDGQPGFVFDAPEEGVAPGQACVLYAAPDGRTVLGGGFIASTVSATER
jgi:tRNA-specific 2-thiouridylase